LGKEFNHESPASRKELGPALHLSAKMQHT